MTKLFRPLILVSGVLCSFGLFATSPSYTIQVVKVAVAGTPEEPEYPDPDKGRHRIPSAPIECIISGDGIQLMSSTVSVADITSFEIWDVEDNFCLASFPDESAFIDVLFSMPSGEYQIHLVTDDYELVGYVAL